MIWKVFFDTCQNTIKAFEALYLSTN